MLVGLVEAITCRECRIVRTAATSRRDPVAPLSEPGRAMEVSSEGDLRNAMIGLLA